MTDDKFDRSSAIALIQGRIDLHQEFIGMCEANNIDPSMSLFSAIAELRSLLREIEGHD